MAFAAARMDDPPERTTPEARLLALAKTGDLDAFEQLVALHERRVFALALRLTGSMEDAKDATQDAFIQNRPHHPRRQKLVLGKIRLVGTSADLFLVLTTKLY